MRGQMGYTIEELNWYSLGTSDVTEFLDEMLKDLSVMYKRNLNGVSFYRYLQDHGRVCVCKKDGKILGVSMCSTYRPLWDGGKTAVYQDLIYGKVPKASYLLFEDMIDFVKRNADAMITMTNDVANISENRLLRKGFSKLETTYLLEV